MTIYHDSTKISVQHAKHIVKLFPYIFKPAIIVLGL